MGFCWKKGWRHRSISRRHRFAAIEEKIWFLAIIRLFLEAQYRRRRIRTQQYQTHPLRPALDQNARAARDGNSVFHGTHSSGGKPTCATSLRKEGSSCRACKLCSTRTDVARASRFATAVCSKSRACCLSPNKQ